MIIQNTEDYWQRKTAINTILHLIVMLVVAVLFVSNFVNLWQNNCLHTTRNCGICFANLLVLLVWGFYLYFSVKMMLFQDKASWETRYGNVDSESLLISSLGAIAIIVIFFLARDSSVAYYSIVRFFVPWA